MLFFTSDWHFNHDREFVWKQRGFSSVDEMNERSSDDTTKSLPIMTSSIFWAMRVSEELLRK